MIFHSKATGFSERARAPFQRLQKMQITQTSKFNERNNKLKFAPKPDQSKKSSDIKKAGMIDTTMPAQGENSLQQTRKKPDLMSLLQIPGISTRSIWVIRRNFFRARDSNCLIRSLVTPKRSPTCSSVWGSLRAFRPYR